MSAPHWSDAAAWRPGACSEAIAWARSQPDDATAWATCPRGDWMLWRLGRLWRHRSPESAERRALAGVDCQCVRLVEQWMPVESRAAVAVVERWAVGDPTVTRADLAAAATSAAASDAAAYAAAAYASASAAAAATYAAAAAATSDASAYAAASSAYAAAAYAAAAASDASAAMKGMRRRTADLVRARWPEVPQ